MLQELKQSEMFNAAIPTLKVPVLLESCSSS